MLSTEEILNSSPLNIDSVITNPEDIVDAISKGSFDSLIETLGLAENPNDIPVAIVKMLSNIIPMVCIAEIKPPFNTSIARDVVRIIQSKMIESHPYSKFTIIIELFNLLRLGIKIGNQGFDLLSSCINSLMTKCQDNSFNVTTASGVLRIHFLLEGMLTRAANTIHPECIVQLIMSLREIEWKPSPNCVQSIIKMLERASIKTLSSSIYQCLLWLKEWHHGSSSLMIFCFDTIFALMESLQRDQSIDSQTNSECLAHIRLVLIHEKTIVAAFNKYLKKALKSATPPSPFIILLLLEIGLDGEGNIKSFIESYIIKQTQLSERLTQIGPIEGFDEHLFKVDIEKLLRRVINCIDVGDEKCILEMVNLGLNLLKGHNQSLSEDLQKKINSIGLLVLVESFQRFSLGRRQIIKILIGEWLVHSENYSKKQFCQWLLKSLEQMFIFSEKEFLLQLDDEILLKMVNIVGDENDMVSFAASLLNKNDYLAKQCNIGIPLILYLCQTQQTSFEVYLKGLCAIRHNSILMKSSYYYLRQHSSEFTQTGLSNTINILVDQLKNVFPLEQFNSLPAALDASFKGETGFLVPLPLLLSTLSRMTSLMNNSNNGASENFLRLSHSMTELLCNDLSWINSDDSMFLQEMKRILVAGLYDFAINELIQVTNLSEKSKIDGVLKLITKLNNFKLSFSTAMTMADCLQSVIHPNNMLSALALGIKNISGKEGIEQLLGHLYSTPWESNVENTQVRVALIEASIKCLQSLCNQGNSWLTKKTLIRNILGKLKGLLKTISEQNPNSKLICQHYYQVIGILGKCLLWMTQNDFPLRDVVAILECADLFTINLTPSSSPHSNTAVETYELSIKSNEFWVSLAKSPSFCNNDGEVTFIKALLDFMLNRLDRNIVITQLIPTLCQDIVLITGKIEEKEEDRNALGKQMGATTFKIISCRTIEPAIQIILLFILNKLDIVQWGINFTSQIIRESPNQANRLLNFVYHEFSWITTICDILCKAFFEGSNYARFMEILQSLFKELTTVCKLIYSCKVPPTNSLKEVLVKATDSLVASIYVMIPIVQQNELENLKEFNRLKKSKSKGKISNRRKINMMAMKERKLIPALIYNIESLERIIVSLNKLFNIKLVELLHRSTARDFRIQLEEIEEVCNQMKKKDDLTDEVSEDSITNVNHVHKLSDECNEEEQSDIPRNNLELSTTYMSLLLSE